MALKIISSWAHGGHRYTEYLCEFAGDGIPLHEHIFSHTTKCVRGKIECYTDEGKSVTRDADNMELRSPVNYSAGLRHGIRALTDGAIFINDMPFGSGDAQ
jgi:hypothetical protein